MLLKHILATPQARRPIESKQTLYRRPAYRGSKSALSSISWQRVDLVSYTSYFLHIISIFLPIYAIHCQHMLDTGCFSPQNTVCCCCAHCREVGHPMSETARQLTIVPDVAYDCVFVSASGNVTREKAYNDDDDPFSLSAVVPHACTCAINV